MPRLLFISHQLKRRVEDDRTDRLVFGTRVDDAAAVALDLNPAYGTDVVACYARGASGAAAAWTMQLEQSSKEDELPNATDPEERNPLVLLYKQPEMKKHRFLSLKGIVLDTQNGAKDLNFEDHYLSDVVREAQATNFAKSPAIRPVNWQRLLDAVRKKMYCRSFGKSAANATYCRQADELHRCDST